MDKRKKRILRKNSVLGAFLLVSIIVLTVLTFRLSGLSFKGREDWVVYFGKNSIIQKGYEVHCAGTRVGMVKSVALVPDERIAPGRHVKAVLTLDKDLTLWEGAEVIVRARGLLGGFLVELDRGRRAGKRLKPGTPLPGRVDTGVTDQFADLVRDNRVPLTNVIGRLARGEGTLGRLLTDEKLYDNLERTSAALAHLAEALDGPQSSLGRILREPKLYDDLAASLSDLRSIAGDLRSGKGVLGRLVTDEKLGRRLDETLTSLSRIARRIDAGEGTLGKLLTDDRLHEELLAGIRALRRFADHVESGSGTLSKLLTNDEIYENMRVLSDNLRAISTDLRQGRGTLGLLLKDEGVYRELQRMLESFRESGEITRENAPLTSLTSFTSLFFNVLN